MITIYLLYIWTESASLSIHVNEYCGTISSECDTVEQRAKIISMKFSQHFLFSQLIEIFIIISYVQVKVVFSITYFDSSAHLLSYADLKYVYCNMYFMQLRNLLIENILELCRCCIIVIVSISNAWAISYLGDHTHNVLKRVARLKYICKCEPL